MAKEVKSKSKTIDCDYLSHTACHFTYDGVEYSLVKGVGYSLPDCDFVQSLVAQGRLIIKN